MVFGLKETWEYLACPIAAHCITGTTSVSANTSFTGFFNFTILGIHVVWWNKTKVKSLKYCLAKVFFYNIDMWMRNCCTHWLLVPRGASLASHYTSHFGCRALLRDMSWTGCCCRAEAPVSWCCCRHVPSAQPGETEESLWGLVLWESVVSATGWADACGKSESAADACPFLLSVLIGEQLSLVSALTSHCTASFRFRQQIFRKPFGLLLQFLGFLHLVSASTSTVGPCHHILLWCVWRYVHFISPVFVICFRCRGGSQFNWSYWKKWKSSLFSETLVK